MKKGKWKGAISTSRKLSDDAVICFFKDGTWRVSPTGHHTHTIDYVHLKKSHKLNRKKINLLRKYFDTDNETERDLIIYELKETRGWV